MARLELIDSGVIFRNPLPGHRVINAIYPYILPLDGELLCLLRNGQALYSPDGMLEVFRSSDGKVWNREGPIRDRTRDAEHYNYLNADLTRLRDGSIVLRISRVAHDETQLMFNSETQGLLPFENCHLRSEDGGKTWSEPVVAAVAEHFDARHVPVAAGGVIELADGRWFQAFETWKPYEDAGSFDLDTYGLFSADGGHTWTDRVVIARGAAEGRSYSHGIPTRLGDGRLFVSLWAAESQLQTYHGLWSVTSLDPEGREWSAPVDLGIPGQTSCAADLGGGRMLIIYSHRDDPDQPGIKVVLSEDGGRNWNVADPLVVWDAYGKEALGVPRTDTYPSSHDVIAYGAPRIIRLDDEHAMACFWCTQGSDTHCRYGRIRVA